MLHVLILWLVDTVGSLGYVGIVALMALESSFFPFPSEVVMVPAGYLAAQGEMDVMLVIIAGIVGSLVGALLNYAIAATLGRAALLKFGKYLFLPEQRLTAVEKFSAQHGEIGTFIGRLLPVIRQYISFPAGLVRMNLFRFSVFTALGAGLWVTVLTMIGYYVGANSELVSKWSHTALFWIAIGIVGLLFVYVKVRAMKK